MLANNYTKCKSVGSGTMRRVPRLTTPAGMPQEVLAIIDVIGSQSRTEILRLLSARGPRTALDLAADMEIPHATVHRHLVQLERCGLIAADAAPGHRRGQKVLWRVVSEKVRELGQTWISYALDTS